MTNRPAAIVCGAGSGIGRAAALGLAEAGYDLVLAARTPAALEATAAAIQAKGEATCLIAPTDLTDPAAARRLPQLAAERFGRLDALANVAGDAPNLPIAQLTPEIWRQCIDTNLSYVVHLTAAAWPLLARQGRSVIVNVSSLASVDPFPGFAAYAAAKVGVNMFTFCTAREGETIGLKAVCLAPGAVETPLLRRVFDEQTVPRQRTLTPEQVAEVIVACLTGRREFTSGETIQLPSP